MGRADALAVAGLLLAFAASASAQTGQTAQIPLQFDFLNPGARSLALGSAFVAVADDATAAFTNPAGLTLSPKRELSAEVRVRQLDTPYLGGGRLSGVPSGNGLDTTAGPIYGTSGDLAIRPYYLSFVYPHGDWSIAVYRHELVRQSNTFISEGPFYRSTSSGAIFDNARLPGLSGSRKISVDTYGGGVAYHVSYRLSVGGSVALYRFSLKSDFGALTFPDGLYSPVDPSTKGQTSTTTQQSTSWRAAANLGVLVTINRKVRLGGVYRQGASFPFTHVTNVPFTPTATQIGEFRTPWVIGGGVRVEATRALTLAADVDRVQYSRLTSDFITFQVAPAVAPRVGIDGGTEVHLGMEYTLLKKPSKPVIRAGVWFDPNHAVQYATDHSFGDDDIRLQAVFPGGQGVWHYCAGFGMPLSRKYEVNVGADFTSGRQYVSASVVARFGK